MDAGWINCGFILAGQSVNVSVRRLSADERQRMAAEIAWFAENLLTAHPQSERWSMLLDRILSQDVSITIDEARFSNTRRAWDQLICLTFQAFVTANNLDGSIRTHLSNQPDTLTRIL
jgi:hypothetical protein